MDQSHQFWSLMGWGLGLIISMTTVYKIYTASLRNKKSTTDLIKDCDTLKRDLQSLKERVERNEKQDEKRDAAIEKLADRVYDQK